MDRVSGKKERAENALFLKVSMKGACHVRGTRS